MTAGQPPTTTTSSQTNDFDKYDQIYVGAVDVSSDSFSPTVTLGPLDDQPLPQTIVAQRVGFEARRTTGGLNGIFEFVWLSQQTQARKLTQDLKYHTKPNAWKATQQAHIYWW